MAISWEHIERATITMEGWEAIGVPGGGVDDNLRLIREELILLASIKAMYPLRAAVVDQLVDRYNRMALKLSGG